MGQCADWLRYSQNEVSARPPSSVNKHILTKYPHEPLALCKSGLFRSRSKGNQLILWRVTCDCASGQIFAQFSGIGVKGKRSI